MTPDHHIASKADALRQQLQAKLGVKGRTLAQALGRAGPQLPRRLRGQGAALVRAEGMAANPKLARQISLTEVDRAYDDIARHLKGIDVTDRRKGRILGLAATVAGNLLIVIVAFLIWLWWRGYV